ncbi:10857_t:CDS:2 [Rhizophagus irregularis]|nr:10857_t:CDS:2 [Rhizophagus irregularis]
MHCSPLYSAYFVVFVIDYLPLCNENRKISLADIAWFYVFESPRFGF